MADWPLDDDFKTIADFRRDNGTAIRAVCTQFVALCRLLNLFQAIVDGSKFKAVNNRDKDFTSAKFKKTWRRWRHSSRAISTLRG
ncbi:hypothetical protein T281_08390 [Rhodomicrobium udaipurense JA643]|uniref:Transposase n=1 Tax=Rhodomicrobium udaipurense TaxID=1202716 RepID=A0A8I1GBC3_9HYPH|nr:hypothetical protein T281_08390 [Rhodomicrobium udaipurense JA643]MBJ7543948.1 transposase [Rhodomicrobium udaipurense]